MADRKYPYGHIVFNGLSRAMKLFLVPADGATPQLRHTLEAHDVGINDGLLPDQYGTNSKCPPGTYFVGEPQACAIRQPDGSVREQNDDDKAYGCFFTPLSDEVPDGPMEQHGRKGIGVHGGGSGSTAPFAMHQGWYATLGCIRLQNQDNEQVFVPFVKYILDHGGMVEISVSW